MKTYTILAVLFLFLSCKNNVEENPKKTFDAVLWLVKDTEGNYAHREEMLDNLVYKVTLKGLPKEEIIKMLGEPERTDNNHLFYEVSSKQVGAFPLHKKFLVIKLDKNNTVEWRKIKD